ncbi:hypothetical protein EGH21_17235 [Halomicroarcula sp. F13]|uniref:Uncharacterized protein n=1 Tax=Haloarcula rubra TaxID=2487747 RepID=A0AAW4PX07_9EURY|nr:hypothetical protein [Halomicroarcula rubra]MBX0324772.1 hypothetical protein [Halomicroarcula rubra]
MHGFQDGAAIEYGDVSWSGFKGLIDSEINNNTYSKARCKTVFCHKPPHEVLPRITDRQESAIVEVTEEEDFYSVSVSRTIERSDIDGGERQVEGTFALYQHGGSQIWTALTGYDPDFFKRGFKWVFKRSEPHISNLYADSEELRDILKRVERELSVDITVDKTVVYSRDEGQISFQTRPYKQVFTDNKLTNGYVDKLNFTATRNGELFFDGFISREGVTKLNAGEPDLFYKYLVGSLVNVVSDKLEVLVDTSREEGGQITEIEVEFDEDVLRSPADNRELIDALDDLTKTTMAVFHDNPYAHLSLVDFVDGSNHDIYVTGSNTVSIVPGYKGSVNSLIRVADQLSKEFQEGVMHVREEPNYDLTDFVA